MFPRESNSKRMSDRERKWVSFLAGWIPGGIIVCNQRDHCARRMNGTVVTGGIEYLKKPSHLELADIASYQPEEIAVCMENKRGCLRSYCGSVIPLRREEMRDSDSPWRLLQWDSPEVAKNVRDGKVSRSVWSTFKEDWLGFKSWSLERTYP